MIGTAILCGASLLYGAAYVIHSAQKRHVRTAILTGLCCLALAGLYALWLWITLA